jgi:capsular polysaccharide export protein
MTQLKLSRDAILRLKLSKYNHTQDLNDCMLGFDDAARVLVIDQTYGDMSVECGGAFPQSFADMLDAALAENPEATIYLKTHPEVNSGSKKGYLTHIQDSDRIVMIREDVNPIDLIQKMDKVYVVTSQMGFEALMCGKPVVCFGVPWYAGWGVTDDRVKDSPAWARRTKKRTVDELFAAAYLHYTRYLNPFTHERGTIFDVIEWLVLQKKMVANQFKRSF